MKIIIKAKDKDVLNAINSVWQDMGRQMYLKKKSDVTERDILDLFTRYFDIKESDITIE